MPITPATLRQAITAVATAPPEARQARMEALKAAATEMAERVTRFHEWLMQADAHLTANPDLPDSREREDLYLGRLQEYTELQDVSGEALLAIEEEGTL